MPIQRNPTSCIAVVCRSRINRQFISGSPTWSSLGFFLAPKRSAMRVVVLQRTRCRSTNKTVPYLGQPYVVKAGEQQCLATLRGSLFRVAASCHSPRRHAAHRHRCRSTNKTVTHPEQPFVVKLRPTLRFAFCCPATQLLVSLPRVAHRIAIAVGLRIRPSLITSSPSW